MSEVIDSRGKHMEDRRIRFLLIILITLAYVALSIFDRHNVSVASLNLALVPVALAAVWFGLQGGLIAGLVAILVNLLMLYTLHADFYRQNLSSVTFWSAQILLILAGVFIGFVFERIHQRQSEMTRRDQAANKLRDQEKFYRHITENLTDLIIIINQEMQATYFSPSLKQATGYEESEVRGQFRKLVLDPEELADIEQKIRDLIRKPGETIKMSPVRLRHKEGHWKYFEGYLTNLLDNPQVNGIVATGFDITDHVLETRELRESDDLYNRLIRLSPTAIAIHCDGKFVFANTAAQRMLRATDEEDIVGQPWLEFIHPDDRETVSKRMDIMTQEGINVESLETRLIRNNGDSFDSEIFAVPIVFEGQLAYLVMMRDIADQQRTEIALLESEIKYRALFEQNNDGVILMDLEGEILDVNPTIASWTGIDRQKWKGRHYGYFLHGENLENAKNTLRKLIEHGSSRVFEFDFPDAKNKTRPVEMTLSIARDETGTPLFVQCFFRDIRRRKESEARLQEREIRYRSLFEQSNDAIFLFRDRKVVETNPKAAELFNFKDPNEMIGMPIESLVAREETSDANHMFETLASGSVPSIYERLGLRVDKDVIPMEIKAVPIYGEDGKLLYIQSIARDISQNLEMEKRLKDFENRYRALFQQTSDAIILFELNGRVVEANSGAAAFYGYPTMEDMIGVQIMDHIHEDEVEDEQKRLSQLVAGVNQSYYERTIISRDERMRIGEVNLTLVRDARGLPSLIQSIVRDITQRKTDEKMLKDKATYDSLTKLLNRQTFIEQLSTKMGGQVRDNDHGALLFIDLDDFKPINDRYGHSAGDFALRTIANRLIYCARDSDLIARHGGDEFVIWLENIRTQESAMQVAERIVSNIAEPILFETRLFQVTCSIGINLFPHPGTTPDELIKKADRAMYEAKQLGKNKIFVFQD